MSALFGFAVGYIVGTRAGREGFERLEQAVREIRRSDEFRNFVELLRGHLQGSRRVTTRSMIETDDR